MGTWASRVRNTLLWLRVLGGTRLIPGFSWCLHSWKLTWKPKRGPIKTTVPLKWGYMDFHVSFWECKVLGIEHHLAEDALDLVAVVIIQL